MAAAVPVPVLGHHVARVGCAVMPELRPTDAEASAAPVGTAAERQTEHQDIHIAAIQGESDDAYAERILATLRGRGIDPGSLVPIGGELLAKVLPAGEPLVVTCWTCPTCGLSVRGAPPRRCINDPGTPGCPVESVP